ncbi:endolytic transglycosylase MltG [Virgibacillus necropolis]|uniref:hypothetical protein n=1 Tax=Virgibacillus necropolis TaxID=163877 RepID=UPI00384F2CF7
MKQPVRAFSIGLFAAGIILLGIVLFFDKPQDKTMDSSQQEMIASLEEDGLHVLNEEEYISLSVKDEPESKKEEKTKTDTKDEAQPDEAEEKKEKQENEVKTFTLKIEPGLASSSISTILEENGIIDSASEFNQYLEENDYSQYVQIGTFKLTTDMTVNEVAETITN